MLPRIPPLQGGRDSDEIAVILTRRLLRHGISTFRHHIFVTELVHISSSGSKASFHLYHATMTTFVDVEIKTMTNLTTMNNLYLVHPSIPDQESPRAEAVNEFDKDVGGLFQAAV